MSTIDKHFQQHFAWKRSLYLEFEITYFSVWQIDFQLYIWMLIYFLKISAFFSNGVILLIKRMIITNKILQLLINYTNYANTHI